MKRFFSDKIVRFLTIVLVILLIASAGITCLAVWKNADMKWEKTDFSDLFAGEEVCALHDISTKAVGSSFRGVEAEEGYSYYLVFLHVTNENRGAQCVEYMGFYPNGVNYGDVVDGGYVSIKDETIEEETDFEYVNMPIIPPGEDVTVAYYLQVKDGVQQIKASYYGFADEPTELEISLQ